MNCLLSIMITTAAEMDHFQKPHSMSPVAMFTFSMVQWLSLTMIIYIHWYYSICISFLHGAYISIDASYKLLSTVPVYSHRHFSVPSNFLYRFNVSDASHDVSCCKGHQANCWIQEWGVQKGISRLEILYRRSTTICRTRQCIFQIYIHLLIRPSDRHSISNCHWKQSNWILWKLYHECR